MPKDKQKILLTKDAFVTIRPNISEEELRQLVSVCYGLRLDKDAQIQELVSFQDRNYLIEGVLPRNEENITCEIPSKFILKIYNAVDTRDKEVYQFINKNLLSCCHDHCSKYFQTPYPIRLLDSKTNVIGTCRLLINDDAIFENCPVEYLLQYGLLVHEDGRYKAEHLVRLTDFLPGKAIHPNDLTHDIAYNWGSAIARITSALEKLPVAEQKARTGSSVSDLLNAYSTLPDLYNRAIEDRYLLEIFKHILIEFRENLDLLKGNHNPKQWIHGDHTIHNVLINHGDSKSDISGIIDFDDSCCSYRIIDLATALTNITAEKSESMLNTAKQLFLGYTSIIKLQQVELDVLYNFVLTRYIKRITVVRYQCRFIDPKNTYLHTLDSNVIKAFNKLYEFGKDKFMVALQ